MKIRPVWWRLHSLCHRRFELKKIQFDAQFTGLIFPVEWGQLEIRAEFVLIQSFSSAGSQSGCHCRIHCVVFRTFTVFSNFHYHTHTQRCHSRALIHGEDDYDF